MVETIKDMRDVHFNIAKEGQKEETEVKEILQGMRGDFIPKETLKFVKTDAEREASAKEAVVQVKTKNGATQVISLPKENRQLLPNSTMARWIKTYGDAPFVGQEVTTEIDENGFNRIKLKD